MVFNPKLHLATKETKWNVCTEQRVGFYNHLYNFLLNQFTGCQFDYEPLINFTELPDGESEKAFLDSWEIDKSTYNKELAQFIEDFGIAALIASATREDSKASKDDPFKPLIWFLTVMLLWTLRSSCP